MNDFFFFFCGRSPLLSPPLSGKHFELDYVDDTVGGCLAKVLDSNRQISPLLSAVTFPPFPL